MSGLALLDLLMLDLPIVILIEEPENLPQVLRLLLEQLAEDVELGPLDLIILVQIKGLQKFFFDLLAVEALEVVGVGGGVDVSGALLNHLED